MYSLVIDLFIFNKHKPKDRRWHKLANPAAATMNMKKNILLYIAKSNNGSLKKNIIHSDQGVHMCENGMIMTTP
jgi:hypothetical protein